MQARAERYNYHHKNTQLRTKFKSMIDIERKKARLEEKLRRAELRRQNQIATIIAKAQKA